MTITPPTFSQLQQIARDVGLHLSSDEIAAYLELFGDVVAAYEVVDGMGEPESTVRYARTGWHRPKAEENPCNAWYVKSTVQGAKAGKLFGRTVALKDNICVAGVPMMVGASTLEGYIPNVDATVVTRILDAGGTILGKATCEYFCLSGSSHTAATGPVSASAGSPIASKRAACSRRSSLDAGLRRILSPSLGSPQRAAMDARSRQPFAGPAS
ncbi:MAG: hypothetical protein GWN84_22085 [Gammaproteobacteria bacterium]|nr:hypothetical protein [Gammaproteobacteria bacterium]NIR88858.1 hypothetical protein [Gammaproteobacteria bacterium]NIU06462.1 hypothetical protein [Gammaproteobacteria bacterium]NIV53354.1 hypothetical protein [Gammaproteobacteria bacterium]NIV74073.1 hypothetical protein [Gammaproteobacteria bacterium]